MPVVNKSASKPTQILEVFTGNGSAAGSYCNRDKGRQNCEAFLSKCFASTNHAFTSTIITVSNDTLIST